MVNPANDPTYDNDAAARFVVERTGVPESVARIALEAHDRYLAAFGIHPTEAEDEPGLEHTRRKYRDLFPPAQMRRREIAYDLETEFVRRVAALTPGLAVAILAAELEYMAKIGIVPASMPDSYRHWAEGWTPTKRLLS
jgi:hypothetical protein